MSYTAKDVAAMKGNANEAAAEVANFFASSK